MPENPPKAPLPPPIPPVGEEKRSVAELVFDVSERTSTLIREEIELAKAEVSDKVGKLIRGSVVGIAAGVFAFLALILVMEGIAWLLNEEVFDNAWAGFFVEAAVFLLVAAAAGLIAYKAVKAGAPPMPAQAIEEAKLIKSTIQGDDQRPAPAAAAAPAPRPAAAHMPPAAPAPDASAPDPAVPKPSPPDANAPDASAPDPKGPAK
jgi:hypothetical protein